MWAITKDADVFEKLTRWLSTEVGVESLSHIGLIAKTIVQITICKPCSKSAQVVLSEE